MTHTEFKEFYEYLKQESIVCNKSELAEKLQYGRVYITNVLNGKLPVTAELRRKLTAVFKVQFKKHTSSEIELKKQVRALEKQIEVLTRLYTKNNK